LPFLGELNGYRILLLEFPYGQIPVGTQNLLQWLLKNRVRPLIAHPERNKIILSNIETIYPFVEMGCMFQVTAGSVIGAFGQGAQDTVKAMLEKGWVSVIATDAHNLLHRAPVLTQAKDWLINNGWSEKVEELTFTTAAKILGIDTLDV